MPKPETAENTIRPHPHHQLQLLDLPTPALRNIGLLLLHGFAGSLINFALSCHQINRAVRNIFWQRVWLDVDMDAARWYTGEENEELERGDWYSLEETMNRKLEVAMRTVVMNAELDDVDHKDLVQIAVTVHKADRHENLLIDNIISPCASSFPNLHLALNVELLPIVIGIPVPGHDLGPDSFNITLFGPVGFEELFGPLRPKIAGLLEARRARDERVQICLRTRDETIRLAEMFGFLDHPVPVDNPFKEIRILELYSHPTDPTVAATTLTQEAVNILTRNMPFLNLLKLHIWHTGDVKAMMELQLDLLDLVKSLNVVDFTINIHVPASNLARWAESDAYRRPILAPVVASLVQGLTHLSDCRLRKFDIQVTADQEAYVAAEPQLSYTIHGSITRFGDAHGRGLDAGRVSAFSSMLEGDVWSPLHRPVESILL